ncbi:GGDEF domain-containing protein [Reinekea marinisedimentorum]|uniref:diguanylate cyclase n=1 Tax=Reinekea marinisedimentorum TaxID=230495 RepID=A0A4R3IE31_9GAMM|nr:GGDEF domain-containing protein [Reinekea marinisedimentorum]TCS43848.1 diguanylate cyclase [Reinekea marinisedimentorum]
MSNEQQPLIRGAQSLSLMLTGYDRDMDAKLSELRKTLKDNAFNQQRFNEVLQEVETAYDNIEELKSKGIKTFRDTLDSILDKSNREIISPLQTENPTITDLLSVAEPLFKELTILDAAEPDGVSETTDLDELRLRLTKQLKTVLKTLSAMNIEDQSCEKLISQLKQMPSWKDLDVITDETLYLVQSRLTEEKKQFEGYLAKVNAKLSHITQIVETDSNTLVDLKALNQQFNESIHDQMREARQKIDEKCSVTTLKEELLQSLDNIADRLKDYQTNYESKLNDLQQSKEQMNIQVQQLEKENLNLISELNKERKLSMIDTLTQLPNRQGFNTRLAEELSRADRYGYTTSLAVIDIDYFKRINDQYGHLVGDKVLKMIGKEMRRVCRESDYLARYGGEEFILLLPQSNLDEAFTAVEKIREHIENCPFHFQNTPVSITVSGGVAERQASEPVEKWINRADTSLYASKGNGRNQITA